MLRSSHRWIKHATGNLSVLCRNQCRRSMAAFSWCMRAITSRRGVIDLTSPASRTCSRSLDSLFLGFFFGDSGDAHSSQCESSTRSISLLSRVAGMKRGRALWLWRGQRIWEALVDCQTSVFIFPPRRGSLAQPVYKGKGHPRGLIITQATTSLHWRLPHWSNP